jgi:chromosome partitioning protein
VDAVSSVGRAFDFISLTRGSDTSLMRGRYADDPRSTTLLYFDVLGTVDPATYSVTGESYYAENGAGRAAQTPPA